jgi:uncharacterized protein YjbI with pentapeptide repeats
MPIFKTADMSGFKMLADLPSAVLSGANLAGATHAGADFYRSLMPY